MKNCAALVTAALLLSPAVALSAPSAGSNVVVIQVTGVRLPVALPGPCLVKGVVAEVREGSAFAPGQILTISVPCSDGKPHIDGGPDRKSASPSPAQIDPSTLQRSKRGIAHLDDFGQLDWAASQRGGRVSGYRVLDGVTMPAVPARTPL